MKPNLTTNLSYPITTSSEFVKNLILLIKNFTKGKILIAEGSGGCETGIAFEKLSYKKISKQLKIKLIDLNREERIKLKNNKALKLKEVWLPKILLDSYLISLPVPKDHSLAVFTCALKNQFGIYLSKDFIKESGERGTFIAEKIVEQGWSKNKLHSFGVHESVFDLNLYKKPDLTICDARFGVRGNELGRKKIEIGKIIASFDPVALDSYIAKIFGYDWRKIKYLVYSHQKIGQAENFEVLKI